MISLIFSVVKKMSDVKESIRRCKIRGCKIAADEKGPSLFCFKHKDKALKCIHCQKWFLHTSMTNNRCGKCHDKKLCSQRGGMYNSEKSSEEIAQQFKVYSRAKDHLSELSDDDEEEEEISTKEFLNYLQQNKSTEDNKQEETMTTTTSAAVSSVAAQKIDRVLKRKIKETQASVAHNKQKQKEKDNIRHASLVQQQEELQNKRQKK
jgi:hypothetical protein